MAAVRSMLAWLVWLGCAAAALTLAAGALLIALSADQGIGWVDRVLAAADLLDVWVFDRSAGLIEISGRGSEVKNALANWGAAAGVWLLGGLMLFRVLRSS